MDEYLIRKAEKKDISFLAEAVIAAEKGRSNKLSYATLFNISEEKAKELIISMFQEEVDGCELSLSSFWVVQYNKEAIAASAAWIEGFNGCLPSQILKSNLILNTFEKESIAFFKTKAPIIKDMLTERESQALQLEYMYISNKHLGKGLDVMLIEKAVEDGLKIFPGLQKMQGQLFKNNIFAIITLRKMEFSIAKSYRSDNAEVLDYIPFNEKLLMERKINKI